MNEKVITVGIADDHSLFREGIRLIVDDFDNIELTLEAENGQDLLTKLQNNTPDVILLDLEMPKMDGVETLKRLKEDCNYQELKIIILTMHKEERMIAYLMELGANGYLMKDAEPAEFEEAIRTVYEEDHYFNESVSHAMLKSLKDKSNKTPTLRNNYQLTSREMEVLELIAKGLTTTEIGKKLFLSTRTIEGHRKNLIGKLGARNTATLIIKAVKEGLISLDF
ncbi:LuxR family two component transcriptional regulator [Kordia periserrulae]|uniref:LuxR family two component transcriptional regulator n=1 Tax=Kordia periserrulae TaxID=701523 RepID=A0A2T6C5W9_9FLAO|nr:response regulator transcription factor [Kordia periserrulae]PTX63693.1 LuxR family two component transcriptional regulator [Kordia periserrulae]